MNKKGESVQETGGGWKIKYSGFQLHPKKIKILNLWASMLLYPLLCFCLLAHFSPCFFAPYFDSFCPQHLPGSLFQLPSPSFLPPQAHRAEARAFWARDNSPLLSFAVPDTLSYKVPPSLHISVCLLAIWAQGLFCTSRCTDGRVRMTQMYSLHLKKDWKRYNRWFSLCF